MKAKDLKGYFPNRASLATTLSILKVSDQLGISEQDSAGTIVTVTYEVTGINLQNIYLGGDGSSSSTGTLSNVLMNADNSIELIIYQNVPINQVYNFTTSYIGNMSVEFTQTNKPIKSSDENETILTKKKP